MSERDPAATIWRESLEERKTKLILQLFEVFNQLLEDSTGGGEELSAMDVAVFGGLFVHEAVQGRKTIKMDRGDGKPVTVSMKPGGPDAQD